MTSDSLYWKDKKVKHTSVTGSGLRSDSLDFTHLHFSLDHMAQCFKSLFMGKFFTPSFFVDIDDFNGIIICGGTITNMLK